MNRLKKKIPSHTPWWCVMTEDQFQTSVIQVAKDTGWMLFHDYDSRRSTAGFPDLVMTRNGRTIFAELKSQRGRIRPEQKEWIAELEKTNGIEVYLWRPSDMDDVVEVLMRQTTPHSDSITRGMRSAEANGTHIGRPSVWTRPGFTDEWRTIKEQLDNQEISRRQAAKELQIGYATLKRILDVDG